MDIQEYITAIQTRRSIRKFQSRSIDERQVNTLLESAMFAPSAVNKQPWNFITVQDRNALNDIAGIHSAAQMMKQAPLAIIVCGERDRAYKPEFMDQDCSAATQNILLAAHGMGLGSVWCGIYPDADRAAAFRNRFGIPAGITPFSVVAIGYPDEQPKQPTRWDLDKIHRERW